MSLQTLFLKIAENKLNVHRLDLQAQYPALTSNDINLLSISLEKNNNSFITELNLDDNNIRDQGVKILSQFKNIKKLYLNENGITSTGAEYLARMPNLKILYISGNPIGMKGLSSLLKSQSLKELFASDIKIHYEDRNEALENLLKKEITLTCLYLENNELESRFQKAINEKCTENKIKKFDELISKMQYIFENVSISLVSESFKNFLNIFPKTDEYLVDKSYFNLLEKLLHNPTDETRLSESKEFLEKIIEYNLTKENHLLKIQANNKINSLLSKMQAIIENLSPSYTFECFKNSLYIFPESEKYLINKVNFFSAEKLGRINSPGISLAEPLTSIKTTIDDNITRETRDI